MAIDSGLKRSNGSDLGNNLFAGNGTSSGNQTFKIIMKNGVDLGRGWYNKNSCSQAVGAVGFKNSAGVVIVIVIATVGIFATQIQMAVLSLELLSRLEEMLKFPRLKKAISFWELIISGIK